MSWNDLFGKYSSTKQVVAATDKVLDEIKHRRRCSVCAKSFNNGRIPASPKVSWCNECGTAFDKATSRQTTIYTLVAVTTGRTIGQFVGFAGFWRLLQDNRMAPDTVTSDCPVHNKLVNSYYELSNKIPPRSSGNGNSRSSRKRP